LSAHIDARSASTNARMTCDEFKEMAPAYVLVALDEDERSACAQHLATGFPHRGCREAVAAAELVAAQLGAALIPQRPSPQVWRSIAARLHEDRGNSPVPEEARRRSLYHLCGWLVAAALVGVYLYNAPLDRRALEAAIGLGKQLASSAH
jgi:anti-sigma-K factor RskA